MFSVIKRWFFWSHLFTGLIASVVILIMAFTGLLLTYERQFKELSEMAYSQTIAIDKATITTDDVVARLQRLHPDEPHIFIRWVNRDGAAIPAWAGKHNYLFHPYTGEVLREGEGIVDVLFHFVTDLHRYLLFEGEYQYIGKNVTAYSNLILVFLMLSGFYLWFPTRLTAKGLKQQLTLRSHYSNKHHRRRHWHFVFGMWALPVLLIIALTATLFHFSWANAALYGLFDEPVPQRETHEPVLNLNADMVSYEALFTIAKQHAKDNDYRDWYSMWMEIGEHEGEARFYIDKSIGHRQELAYSLYLDTRSGEVTKVLRKEDWSKGGQAWGTSRFLHTGEYFGFIGQSVAGIVCLLCCILVYTGTLLGIKRLSKR